MVGGLNHEDLMIKMQKVKAVGCEDNFTRETEFEKEISH